MEKGGFENPIAMELGSNRLRDAIQKGRKNQVPKRGLFAEGILDVFRVEAVCTNLK